MTCCKTDPFNNRRWPIGNAKNFICFDWCCNQDNDTVTVHSEVVAISKPVDLFEMKASVPVRHAYGVARRQVAKAWEWIETMGIQMTAKERKESKKNGEAFIENIRGSFIIDRVPWTEP